MEGQARIRHLHGQNKPGAGGKWILNGVRVPAQDVVRRHPQYIPWQSTTAGANLGYFRGPQYPQRRANSDPGAGYPTVGQWKARRGSFPMYHTVPLGIRGRGYGPGDFDWFSHQFSQGVYAYETQWGEVYNPGSEHQKGSDRAPGQV